MAKLFRELLHSWKYDYVTNSKTLINNAISEVVNGGFSLNLPLDPVVGDNVYIIDALGTFSFNPVILMGNGKSIEGSSSFTLDKFDEHIQFFFNGNQWIFLNRFFYEFSNPSGGGTNRMVSKSVGSNYTLLPSDYKLWIKANGNITITMMTTPPDFFEAIIQNVGTGVITIAGISNTAGNKIKKRWNPCHVYFDGSSWTAVGALDP